MAPPERFPGGAITTRGGVWTADQLPMYLHTFAFIVRQALISWWQTLPQPAAKP